jgi:RHS repeat-associated protein
VVATNGSNSRTYRVDLANSHLLAFTDELGHETDYQYNAAQLLSQINYPKGNFDTFIYDARGNLTSTTRHPVAGSAMAAITTSAVYPSTCANPVTCNHPTSTTDGNGHTTDYTYDPIHGGVATITGPAPTVGATRPQTRYSYTQIDSAGAPSSTGVFVLTGTSACATGSTCAGTADETVTSYAYGANLLLSASATAAGDGSVSSSTAFTYDKVGNVITQDGPLAGANDVTRFFYDAVRQKTGTIYPDADGASPFVYLAERIGYNARGNVASFDSGTVTDPTQAALTAMAPTQSLSSSFDSYGRKVTDVLSAGGTTYSLTQYSYDGLSRPSCVATRMNPATFGSLSSDACTAATAGSFGPDLIRQTGYDAAGHPTSLREGVGTSAPRTTSYTYNLNGNVNSITDPKGNVTAYVYDDFVRLYKVQFPSPTAPGSVSTTDYEQYSFDNNDNITVRRLRNGTTLTYGYDALNRLTSKTPSSGASNPTSTYSYDLLNNMRSAAATTAAHTIIDNFTYDALSRKKTDVSLIDGASAGTKTSSYDSAGRRISFQLGNGFTTTYEYDYRNNLKTVREGGTTPLAIFDYDNLGRRINRSYPQNGVSTAYTYNDGSDLTKLEIKGATNPTTIDLGGYNPAGQIGYRTNSNDAYAWTAGANVSASYVTNGLNQFTAVAGATQSYDLKGNLAALGGKSLTYGAENALMTSGTTSFLYDALGRLVNSNTSNRFDYDDDQLVAETNAVGTYARWYVAAPGGSEPLVWYEGTQTDKRYLDQDERGSIVRITNASGGLVGINTYDEFGVPGPANTGRFQYTGQAWMPEAGLYYNRARMYAPTLGRFVQTDPLGMQAGFNLYNYTSSDPINATDPSGLDPCTGCIPIVGNPYPPGYEVTPGVGWGGPPQIGAPDGFVPREALDRARDAAKEIVVTARRTTKVLKQTAVIVVDAVRTAQDDVEYALDTASNILVGPACCFTAGTLVSTPHGLTPIEQLRVGDLVMSRDEKTGQTAPKPIEQVIPAHPRPIWSVEVRYGSDKHETYQTTADHPWRSHDHRWLASAELTAGQLLETEHGTATVVKSLATGHSNLTYNLTIADFHTYFVGHAETWVHNSCEQPHKANSPVWKSLRHWRGPTKTDGKRYYEWDYTHHNIEVYNKRGEHIGVIDPFTAAVVGGPVEGREINVK